LSLLTERRRLAPWGLDGGGAGAPGANFIVRRSKQTKLPGKTNLEVRAGERIRIETPGAGACGRR
jgi:N-methylhydantoinase B